MHDRNFDQILLCIFNSFGNGFLNFFCFSETMTHNTIFISHHHQSRKTESTSTFCCFNNTVNGNHFFFQFQVSWL